MAVLYGNHLKLQNQINAELVFEKNVWGSYSKPCRNFLSMLLDKDSGKKIVTAKSALEHTWIVGA